MRKPTERIERKVLLFRGKTPHMENLVDQPIIPLKGEMVLNVETRQIKIGDGIWPVHLLPYATDAEIAAIVSNPDGFVVGVRPIAALAPQQELIP